MAVIDLKTRSKWNLIHRYSRFHISYFQSKTNECVAFKKEAFDCDQLRYLKHFTEFVVFETCAAFLLLNKWVYLIKHMI